MKSRTRSRKPASIGSNPSSTRPTAISPSEPRTGNFVLLLVMAWSPPAHNAGIVWVSAPGDYATFNSNHTPDGTPSGMRGVLNDAVSIYFLDAQLASAFVAQWCAGYKIERAEGVFRIRTDDPT